MPVNTRAGNKRPLSEFLEGDNFKRFEAVDPRAGKKIRLQWKQAEKDEKAGKVKEKKKSAVITVGEMRAIFKNNPGCTSVMWNGEEFAPMYPETNSTDGNGKASVSTSTKKRGDKVAASRGEGKNNPTTSQPARKVGLAAETDKVDGNKQQASNKAEKSKSGTAESKALPKKNEITTLEDSEDWVCLCCPYWDRKAAQSDWEDIEDENNEEEGKDEDEEHETVDENEDDDSCPCPIDGGCLQGKPASEHPDWKIVISSGGWESLKHMFSEMGKRDQDEWGLHIYNDFTGYGTTELIENQLLEFNKAYKKKDRSAKTLWPFIEALAWFMNGDHLTGWHMSDDSSRNAELVALIGTALLYTRREITDPSAFKDLGLVQALFLQFAEDCADLCDTTNENGWTKPLVQMADADTDAGKIKGLSNTEHLLKKIREDIGVQDEDEDEEAVVDEDDGNDYELPNWKSWNWPYQFALYSSRHRTSKNKPIGGSHYDITKMTKKERWQYDLRNHRALDDYLDA